MKISDPAHAVRILEDLVKQGDKRLDDDNHFDYGNGYLGALIEDAKAVLKIWRAYQNNPHEEVWNTASKFLISQAQSVTRWMPEFGMQVPK